MNRSSDSFFLSEGVIKGKDRALKIRLQTLIKDRGITESEFYKKLGFVKQYWYALSWGIQKPNDDVMFKISKELKVDSRLIFPEGLSK